MANPRFAARSHLQAARAAKTRQGYEDPSLDADRACGVCGRLEWGPAAERHSMGATRFSCRLGGFKVSKTGGCAKFIKK